MAAIAREAGISKALLYHYFPSKQAFFVATLEQQAGELAARVRRRPGLPPAEQLAAALDAFLGWVEEHAEGYGKLLVGAATHPEVRELVEGVRAQTAERILAGLAPDPAAAGGARRRARLALVHGRGARRLARAPRPRPRRAARPAAGDAPRGRDGRRRAAAR